MLLFYATSKRGQSNKMLLINFLVIARPFAFTSWLFACTSDFTS